MESGGVLNYFSNTSYSLLLMQGIILSVCVLIGFYFLYKNLLNLLEKIAPTLSKVLLDYSEKTVVSLSDIINFFKPKGENKDNTGKYFQLVINTVIALLLLSIFMLSAGILSNRIADKWIDTGNSFHLCIKTQWLETRFYNCKKEEDKLENTDDAIKCFYYNKILKNYKGFSTADSPSKKHQIYYYFKNRMMIDPRWCDYLNITQNIINLTQVLALAFFSLLVILLFSFILIIVQLFLEVVWKDRLSVIKVILTLLIIATSLFLVSYKHQSMFGVLLIVPLAVCILYYFKRLDPKIHVIATMFVFYIALGGYYASCVAWVENESEFDQKVFGQYSVLNKYLKENNSVVNDFFEHCPLDDDMDKTTKEK